MDDYYKQYPWNNPNFSREERDKLLDAERDRRKAEIISPPPKEPEGVKKEPTTSAPSPFKTRPDPF